MWSNTNIAFQVSPEVSTKEPTGSRCPRCQIIHACAQRTSAPESTLLHVHQHVHGYGSCVRVRAILRCSLVPGSCRRGWMGRAARTGPARADARGLFARFAQHVSVCKRVNGVSFARAHVHAGSRRGTLCNSPPSSFQIPSLLPPHLDANAHEMHDKLAQRADRCSTSANTSLRRHSPTPTICTPRTAVSTLWARKQSSLRASAARALVSLLPLSLPPSLPLTPHLFSPLPLLLSPLSSSLLSSPLLFSSSPLSSSPPPSPPAASSRPNR